MNLYTETGIVAAQPMIQGQVDDPWAEELEAFEREHEASQDEVKAPKYF